MTTERLGMLPERERMIQLAKQIAEEQREEEKRKAEARNIAQELVSEDSDDNQQSNITNQIITQDDNPPQTSLTSGWIYVPSVGLEFAPDLNEFNTNWYDTHRILKEKGFLMPTPAETWALIFEAKANLDKPEFRKIYEFFTEKTSKNTWHGEWQDAFFKEDNGKMYMHRFKEFNPKKEPVFLQGIDITGTYLIDCYADISKKTNITSEGLCKIKDSRNNYVEGENIRFWYPRDESVAGFVAGSGGADLSCGRFPSLSDASLGVRYARRVAPSVSEIIIEDSLTQNSNSSLLKRIFGGRK